METLRTQLDNATQRLAAVSDSPRFDAELLMSHALEIDRSGLILRLDDAVRTPEAFSRMLERRLDSEPVAYILGEWEFFSMPLAIRPPTLVPRPETEHLVEAVLEVLPVPNARILEIGTGSGCIALALAHHAAECTIVATDIKRSNLLLALENATRHKLHTRIEFLEGNLFESIAERDTTYHVVCSNPPYVQTVDRDTLSRDVEHFEDPIALFAGGDGLDIIRLLIAQSGEHLEPGGYLIMEIGIHQHAPVTVLLEEYGYDDIHFKRDLAGIDRIAIARKPS